MKKCTKCGVEKGAEEFYRRTKAPDGLQCRCKTCQHADSLDRAKRSPEKTRVWRAQWAEKNAERLKAARRKWAREHPEICRRWVRENREKFNEIVSAMHKRNREELADTYVRSLIAPRVGCKRADVPPELVAAKRAYVAAKRLIKEKTK